MNQRFSKMSPQPWAQFALLLGLCFVIYFVNLGQWDLWSPDEPRYAEVSREMVNGGDWILMHRNGELYTDKPPLFFWFNGISSFLWQGVTPFSVRFPSALFGTLTVLLTFFIGRRLYSSRTGFLSGLILATSFQFAYLSTRGNIDTTLTFFTTASILCFIQWYQSNQEGEISLKGMKGLSFYGYYVGMALATLAKGPVGFILPLLVTLLFLLVQKDWKGIKAIRLLPGMLLFLAIVLSWYLPAVLMGGKDYLNATLLHHSFDRFAKGSAHIRPIYYYLYQFPPNFLPWIIFLPAAMAYGFSRAMIAKRKEFLFLMIWFICIFGFFTLSKGKRGLYFLPLFPAVSLMVGRLWEDFVSFSMKHFRHEWITIPLYGLMGVICVAGVALPWVISAKLPSYFSYSLPVAFLLVGVSIGLFVLNRFKYYGAIFLLLIGMMAGGFFYALRVVFPLVNPYKSSRFICQEITTRMQPGEKLAIYGDFEPGPFNFYTGIVPIPVLEEEEALLHFLRSPERGFCLLKSRDFLKFQSIEGRPEVQLIVRRRIGDGDFVLISNR
ncbi:MAG: glycosyltransferase family 39 protein [Thermodesulfobacteriota bacterium]